MMIPSNVLIIIMQSYIITSIIESISNYMEYKFYNIIGKLYPYE